MKVWRFGWLGVLYGLSCLQPTEMTVTITTDIPCAQLGNVQVFVGRDGAELETNAISAQATNCADGKVGSLVVLPGPSSGGSALFSVVAGVGVPTDGCRASSYTDCVVARRSVRFIDHTPLSLPISLSKRCVGLSCKLVGGAPGTCEDGRCVPASIAAPGTCPSPGTCGDPHFVPYVELASNASANGLGYGVQQHAFYAEGDGRYWVLYFDPKSPTTIQARATADYAQAWQSASPIELGAGNTLTDGAGFSVAYAFVNGVDVVHVIADVGAQLPTPGIVHIRAAIVSGAIQPTSNKTISTVLNSTHFCPDDGPVTVVTKKGVVWDSTAWVLRNGQCDNDVLLGNDVEDGSGKFSGVFTNHGFWNTTPFTHAHQLVEIPSKDLLMSAWPDTASAVQTDYQVVALKTSDTFAQSEVAQTSASASDGLFYGTGTGALASFNDWALCRVSDTDVHAIRHVLDSSTGSTVGPFEELRWDGAQWRQVPPPPPLAGASNSGVVLVSDADSADGMVLSVIDAAGDVHMRRWTEPLGWGPDKIFSNPGAHAQSVAGTGCGKAHPQVLWIKGKAAPFTIVASDVQGLFLP